MHLLLLVGGVSNLCVWSCVLVEDKEVELALVALYVALGFSCGDNG